MNAIACRDPFPESHTQKCKMCNVVRQQQFHADCINANQIISNYVLLLPEFPLAVHSCAEFDLDLADAVGPSIVVVVVVDNTFVDVVVVQESFRRVAFDVHWHRNRYY